MSLKNHLKSYIYKRGRCTLDEVLQAGKEYKPTIKHSTIERTMRIICNEVSSGATRRIDAMKKGTSKTAPIIGYEVINLGWITEPEYICECDDGAKLYGVCHFPEQSQLF